MTAGTSISLDELIQCRHLAQSIALTQQRKVHTQRAGAYASGFRGRGMDFEEVRVYQAGDDIRTMDWRVTARTGVPHTKIYCEERERPVLLLIDLAPSMYFGTKVAFKSVIAAKVAALITWAGIQNHDRVGCIINYGGEQFDYRPQTRVSSILPMLKHIAQLTDQLPSDHNEQSFTQALLKLRRVAKPGSLVFVLSDFVNFNEEAQTHLGALSRHAECELIFIYDPLEATPPPPQQYWVSDGEHKLRINTKNKKFCQQYSEQFQQRLRDLQSYCYRYRLQLSPLATDDEFSRIRVTHGSFSSIT